MTGKRRAKRRVKRQDWKAVRLLIALLVILTWMIQLDSRMDFVYAQTQMPDKDPVLEGDMLYITRKMEPRPEAAGAGMEAGQAAGAETGNQEKASAFKEFLDGLFGAKQEKKEPGAEEKAAEKGTEPPAGKTEEKSFSQADMDAAIEKAKQDWEAQAEEAKRQAKLSPEEKAAEEQKKKDEQIAELQAKLLKSDLQKKATASLEKDGYPVGLAELLDYTSEEAMEKSLSKLTDTFKGSLQAAVESRLRGKTPAGLGNAASAENMLRDQIARNIRGL